MKTIITTLCLFLFALLGHTQGFVTSSMSWTLPSGGNIASNGHNYGFYTPYGPYSSENNSLNWSILDMDGDGKTDLVVTAQGDGTYGNCFGVGTNPYWKVYLNTGSAFSTTATNWALPPGGNIASNGHNFGFYTPFGPYSSENNSLNWTTFDINGDGMPDLVVTAQGDGTYGDCFGVGSNPYWKVYLNTGSGFSNSALNWYLPSGGNIASNGHNFGFYTPYGSYSSENNSLNWTTSDMDGDGMPDLVVTALGDGSYGNCFGVGSSPHWKVYLNTGTSFSNTASTWVLPSGGKIASNGHSYGYNATSSGSSNVNNSLSWTMLDISADGKADLIVTAQGNGTTSDCFGVGSNPFWKVYLNTGSAFSTTALNWGLPSGGKVSSTGHNYGFNSTAAGYSSNSNSLGWSTIEINGDGKPDLVVTAQGDGTYGTSFGVGSSPYWKVYPNTGSGFSTTAVTWALPAGGDIGSDGHNYGFNAVYGGYSYITNSLNWTTLDINGDQTPDLVVTAQGDGTYANCFGVGSSPHWNVYLNTTSFVAISTIGDQSMNKAYPNPFSDQLKVDIDPMLIDQSFVIFNNLGQSVHTGKLNQASFSLDLSWLPQGIYFLKLDDHDPKTIKLVKQ